MSSVEDLVQWLSAQLDEDERIARTTASEFGAVWTADGDSVGSEVEYVSVVEEPGSPIGFIAAHDPARVLREIDAKRQVLAEFEQADRYSRTTWGQSNADQSRARALGKVLRLLALPYADRDGYLDEWRP